MCVCAPIGKVSSFLFFFCRNCRNNTHTQPKEHSWQFCWLHMEYESVGECSRPKNETGQDIWLSSSLYAAMISMIHKIVNEALASFSCSQFSVMQWMETWKLPTSVVYLLHMIFMAMPTLCKMNKSNRTPLLLMPKKWLVYSSRCCGCCCCCMEKSKKDKECAHKPQNCSGRTIKANNKFLFRFSTMF